MSKHKTTQPTLKESRDTLAFLCGEDVEFPFKMNNPKVELPNLRYLESRFNNKQ